MNISFAYPRFSLRLSPGLKLANAFGVRDHSYRKATNGSTLVARLAGMRHATNATSDRLIETKTNVVTSVAVTPNNKLAISRVNAYAPIKPNATPTIVSRRNWPNTSRRTSRALAPNAILIPIS